MCFIRPVSPQQLAIARESRSGSVSACQETRVALEFRFELSIETMVAGKGSTRVRDILSQRRCFVYAET